MLPAANTLMRLLRALTAVLALLFAVPVTAQLVQQTLELLADDVCCGELTCDDDASGQHCPRCHVHIAYFVGAEHALTVWPKPEPEAHRARTFGLRADAFLSMEHRDAPYRPPAA